MISNKVIIITGASSGIGQATAIKALSLGNKVVLAARREELLEKFHKDFPEKKENILIVKTDVSSEEQCKLLIEKTITHFGRIDILINNAGISMRALFKDLKLSVFKQVMEVDFYGTLYCSHYALPHLLKSKGSLVAVSSVAGFAPLPGRTAYTAAKYAMQGMMEALRLEQKKNGLHVLLICPGFTASNIRVAALDGEGNAQGESPREEHRMMTAEKVAHHMLKGIKRKRNLIILTPQGKGAYIIARFFPRLYDKVAYGIFKREPDSPLR